MERLTWLFLGSNAVLRGLKAVRFRLSQETPGALPSQSACVNVVGVSSSACGLPQPALPVRRHDLIANFGSYQGTMPASAWVAVSSFAQELLNSIRTRGGRDP